MSEPTGALLRVCVQHSIRRSVECWLIACCGLGVAQAVELDPALVLAEKLVQQQAFDAAITEYKRFICFHPTDARVSEVYTRIAAAHRARREWTAELAALQSAVETAIDDEVGYSRRIDVAVARIAARDYSAAELDLLRVSQSARAAATQARAFFALGVCYLYTFRWSEAREALQSYFSIAGVPDEDRDKVLGFLAPGKPPRRKSARLAKWLSAVVPGSGQIYAGRVARGLNALAINVATGALLANPLYHGRMGDAYAVFPLFQRYYQGNVMNSARAVAFYNERTSIRYAEQALVLLAGGTYTDGQTPGVAR